VKYLLDTHILLWFVEDNKRLKPSIKEIIENGENYISVASFWEVAIKMSMGKYDFKGGYKDFVFMTAESNISVIPIKEKHLEEIFNLPSIHRDPFDRLIIATSKAENIPLITSDENIQKYEFKYLAN
jgi:PIN domain nuclease of toxin-antitoxin system